MHIIFYVSFLPLCTLYIFVSELTSSLLFSPLPHSDCVLPFIFIPCNFTTLDDISFMVSFFHFCNYHTIFLLYFDAFLSFTCISYFDLPLLHLGTSISTLFFPRSSKFFSPCCIIRLLENIKNILDENIFNSKHFTSLRLTTTNGCLFPRAT